LHFWFPAPSTDSKRLFVYGGKERGELMRYDLKTRELVPYLSGISAEFLDFSKDGIWVTYVTFPEGILWRSKLDGSQRMQLTSAPMSAALPRWSPDGKRIAFMGKVPGRSWKIYIVPFDGGSPEPLTQDERDEMDPTWSSDGNSVVFGESFDSSQPTHIYAIDLRTRSVSTLPGSDGLFSPRWSPDGRFIAALGPRASKMMLFDVKAQKWTQLLNAVVGGNHVWSKDSKYVYILDTSSNAEMKLYRVRIADHNLERVEDFMVPEGFAGSIGAWSVLAPDESPLFVRDLTGQEIYALDVDLP
jgi:Tol biopolymer transport system component